MAGVRIAFQVRFPGIYFHYQSARFFLLALIIILTLYSHGYWQMAGVQIRVFRYL